MSSSVSLIDPSELNSSGVSSSKSKFSNPFDGEELFSSFSKGLSPRILTRSSLKITSFSISRLASSDSLLLFFLRIFFSNAVWWQDSIVIPLFVKVLDSLELFFPDTFDRDAFI